MIDEIDDENWLMMFVQELEVQVKQIIQMERKIKSLIHQAREGRADGYKELIKVSNRFRYTVLINQVLSKIKLASISSNWSFDLLTLVQLNQTCER